MSSDRPPAASAAPPGGRPARAGKDPGPRAAEARHRRAVLASRGALVATFLLSIAVLVGLYAVAVATNVGQLWEYQLFVAVEDGYTDPTTGPSEALVSVLPLAASGAAGLVAAASLALPRLRRRGALALTALVGANVTTQVLKGLLERPRLENAVPWAGGNSLPSGHMTLATSAVLAALILVPPRARPLTALLGSGLTAFTGAVAYLEAWHRPSDMAAAVAVSMAWGALTLLLFGPPTTTSARPRAPGADPAMPARGRGADALARGAAVVLCAAGSLGVVLGAGLLVATLDTSAVQDGAHALAPTAGVLLSTAPSVLAWGAVLHGLRPARP